MELFLTVCYIFEGGGWTFIAVCAGLISSIAYIVWAVNKTDNEELAAVARKVCLVALIAFVPLFILSTLGYVPDSMVRARLQMVKLEVTSPEIREEVYRKINDVFVKLEQKYLDKDNQDLFEWAEQRFGTTEQHGCDSWSVRTIAVPDDDESFLHGLEAGLSYASALNDSAREIVSTVRNVGLTLMKRTLDAFASFSAPGPPPPAQTSVAEEDDGEKTPSEKIRQQMESRKA